MHKNDVYGKGSSLSQKDVAKCLAHICITMIDVRYSINKLLVYPRDISFF